MTGDPLAPESDAEVLPAEAPLMPDANSSTIFSRLAQIERNIDPQVMGAPLKYNALELAEKTGVPLQLIEDFVRWLGRPPQSPKKVRYTDSDVVAMKHALEFVTKEGIDPYAMGTLVRTASASLQRLALQQVEGLIQDIARTQNVTDTQARMIAGEIAPSQAAQLQPLIDHIWRRQYAEAVRTLTTTAIAQRGFSTDDRDFPLVRAVGFADLVDFTERTKDTSAHEFNALIRDFTDVCWDIVNSRGGRIISFLGDAVFFVADDIKTGVEVSLGLSEHGQTGMCGPVRVGLVWTRVLKANGDVFGPGVNLVSRITRAATPNEVFIDDSLAERLARNPDYSIVEEPAFDARGIGWVQPFRIRYADDPRNQEDE